MPHAHRHFQALTHALSAVLLVFICAVGVLQSPRTAQAANITISGLLTDFDFNPFDCSSQNLIIRVKVNGAGASSTTCTDGGGAFSISGVSVSGSDVITVFVDDPSFLAAYVTRAAASPVDITLDLYQDQVWLGHQDAGPITNANLDQYDSGQNANIPFTVTGGNFSSSAAYVNVAEGKTYLPGGTVTVLSGTMAVGTSSSGTMTLDTAGNSFFSLTNYGALNINADTTLGAGGMYSTGTVTSSGSSTVTINGSAAITNGGAGMTLYNLTGSGTGTQYLFGPGTISITNNLAIPASMTVTTNTNVSVGGSLTTTGSGSFIYNTSATPTVTVSGSSIGGGSGAISFYNLTKSGSGTTTWTGAGANAVINTLTVSAGTLVGPSSLEVSAITESGGTFSPGTNVLLNGGSNSSLGVSGSFNNLTINKGLVGYWKLDETSLGTAADQSGYNDTGTHTGSPTLDSDVPTLNFSNTRSISLNGTSQYVDLGNPAQLNSRFSNKITLSAWIKPSTLTGFRVIVGKSANAEHNDPYYTWALFQISNTLSFRVSSSAGSGSTHIESSGSGTGALTTSAWQHVIGTYDGATMKIYINGIEVGSTSKTGTIMTSSQNARIGARHTTSMDEFFAGKIDDVRVYSRGLSATEVRTLADGSDVGFSGSTYTLGAPLTVTGDLAIYDGTLDVSGSNHAVTVGGSWNNQHGIFTPQSGTVTLNGTSSGKTMTSSGQHFNNLTVSGSGGGWTLADRLFVDGTLTQSDGTLDVSTSNFTIQAGTLNQSAGTLTPRSGKIVLNSQSNQSVVASSSLNNVRLEDASETNLAGYWKLDELFGVTAKDWSGNARHGTNTNAPSRTLSLNSTTTYDNVAALDLDGTDDYVTMGDVIDRDDTADLTVSGWFNRDTSSTDDVIVAKRNGNAGSDVGYVVWIDASTDKLRFEASDGTDEFELASTSTFTTTGWHYFVAVWDQDSTSNSEIFIDGVDDNATQTGTIGNVNDLSNSVALRIGAESDAGAPFDGKIDDVRIYTAALTTTQGANLAAGRYADGSAGTATFTLGGNVTVGAGLTLDSGTLDTSSGTLTVTSSFSLLNGHGAYVGGSNTQTFNAGVTVSGSSFTGGSGTLDVNGSFVENGGTVTTGAGNWTVSTNFTHSSGTFTASAGHTLTMDGTGTLTSNGQTLQNVSINSSGTVALAAATHTMSGNLLLGGSGTPTVTGSTILMNGTGGKTIDGGGKTLATLTIDPSSASTITLQNTDLTVSTALSVASGDTLSLNSGRALTLSGNTGTTLTLTGTVSGAGTLVYQNSATTFPTGGTLSSIVRFDAVHGAMTIPNRSGANNFGSNVELYNNSGASRTLTLASAGSQTIDIAGTLDLQSTGGSSALVIAGNTNNPTVNLTGNLTASNASGAYTLSLGSGTWTVAGNVDLTNIGTFNHNSGTVVMSGTANVIGNSKTFNHLTVNGSGTTVTATSSDFAVAGTLTVGGVADGNNDTFSIASGRTVTSETGGTVTVVGSGTDTISGSGLLVIQHSNLGTSGTLSVPVRFDPTSGNINMPARTYGGDVELYNNSGASARTVTMQSGTQTLSGNLTLNAANTQNISLATTGNPTVNIAGDIDYTGAGAGSESISSGSGTWTVSGNIDLEGSSVAPTLTTFVVNGAGKNLKLNARTITGLTVAGTITVTSTNGFFSTLAISASSTLTIDTNRRLTELTGGSVTINSSGTIDGPGTLALLTGTLSTVGTLSTNVSFDNTAGDLVVPNRVYAGSTRTVTLISNGFLTTIGSSSSLVDIQGNLLIDDSQCGGCSFTADTHDPVVTIGGNLTATTDSFADLSLGSGTWTISGNVNFTDFGSVNHNNGTVVMNGSSATLTTVGQPLNNLTISGGSVTMAGDTTVANNLTISGGSLTAPSSTLTISGNLDNNATLIANSGTIVLNAGTTGKTVEVGSSALANLTFNNAAGGWTIQADDLSLTGNLTLTAANTFVVQSGRAVTVAGNFTNSLSDSATTWTGSTLYLNGSGGVYDLNTKTSTGDTYGTFRVGAAEDVAVWNSNAASFVIDTGGSLLSEDHAGIDGRLQIYGSANSRTNEYFSYATDFDGVALGSPRDADVRFADGASLTVDAGDTLAIQGQSITAHRSQLTRIGSGGYDVIINGTIDAQNYDFHHLNTNGLTIGSTATVTDISNGTFDNSVGGTGAAYITVSGITSTASFAGMVFDSDVDGTDSAVMYNVKATGSGILWTFTSPAGNKNGSAFELEVSGASLVWDVPVLTVSDGTSTDVDLATSLTELAGNWTVTPATGIASFSYAFGTSSGAANTVAFTSAGSSLAVTHPGLTLSNGTTYYLTIRAKNINGETVIQSSSDGILIDGVAPEITDLLGTGTSSSITVRWTTNEPATSQVEIGTTTSYGSATTVDSELVTSHTVVISSLSPNVTYHLRAVSSDQAGNTSNSADLAVNTITASTPSTQTVSPPTILPPRLVDGRAPGIVVNGRATGNQTVRIYIDGRRVKSIALDGPSTKIRSFSVFIPVRGYKNGTHALTARAVDRQGHFSAYTKKMPFTIRHVDGRTILQLRTTATYIVQPGDSLWKLSRLFLGRGALYQRIISTNKVKYPRIMNGIIYAGQVLRIVP